MKQWSSTNLLQKTRTTWETGLLPADVATRIVSDVGAMLAAEPNVIALDAPVTVGVRGPLRHMWADATEPQRGMTERALVADELGLFGTPPPGGAV